jgi:hypothetical protein
MKEVIKFAVYNAINSKEYGDMTPEDIRMIKIYGILD